MKSFSAYSFFVLATIALAMTMSVTLAAKPSASATTVDGDVGSSILPSATGGASDLPPSPSSTGTGPAILPIMPTSSSAGTGASSSGSGTMPTTTTKPSSASQLLSNPKTLVTNAIVAIAGLGLAMSIGF